MGGALVHQVFVSVVASQGILFGNVPRQRLLAGRTKTKIGVHLLLAHKNVSLLVKLNRQAKG